MKNRLMGSLAVAFHTVAWPFFCGLILRLLMTAIAVVEQGHELSRYLLIQEDKFSLLILFGIGFLACGPHVRFSAGMQLSPAKRTVGFVGVGAVISALFALLDVLMIKLYYNYLYVYGQSNLQTFLEEHVFADRGEIAPFTEKCWLLILNTAVLYFCILLCGYLFRYMLNARPIVLVLWVIGTAAGAAWLWTLNQLPTGVTVLSCLAIFLLLLVTLCPVIFLFAVWVLCCAFESAGAIICCAGISVLVMYAVAVTVVRRYRYALPLERRKEMLL